MIEKFVSGLPDKDQPPKPTLEETLEKHKVGIYKKGVRDRIGAPPEGTPPPEGANELRDRMLGEKPD